MDVELANLARIFFSAVAPLWQSMLMFWILLVCLVMVIVTLLCWLRAKAFALSVHVNGATGEAGWRFMVMGAGAVDVLESLGFQMML